MSMHDRWWHPSGAAIRFTGASQPAQISLLEALARYKADRRPKQDWHLCLRPIQSRIGVAASTSCNAPSQHAAFRTCLELEVEAASLCATLSAIASCAMTGSLSIADMISAVQNPSASRLLKSGTRRWWNHFRCSWYPLFNLIVEAGGRWFNGETCVSFAP